MSKEDNIIFTTAVYRLSILTFSYSQLTGCTHIDRYGYIGHKSSEMV